MNQNMPKVMKIFVQTKLGDKYIDYKMNSTYMVRQAINDNNLYRCNDKTSFCCYKTTYENKPAITILFIMELPGPITGSSSASEYVMDIMSSAERYFLPICYNEYTKEIDSNRKIIGLLKIVKLLELSPIDDYDGYLAYNKQEDIY